MKRFFAMILLFALVCSFSACGTDDSPSTSDSDASVQTSETDSESVTDTESDASTSEEEAWEPIHVVDNLFLAGDQYNQDVLVYDLDQLSPGDNLDSAVIWSHHVGISHIAGLKYRKNTVFGDVILVAAGATNGKAQMISYPEGKVLWSTNAAGNNPHCIEILPSGNIVVASSTGGTLRLFKTAALLTGDTKTAATYTDTVLSGAHGALYDPEYKVLWGLGGYILSGFEIVGTGVDEALVKNQDKTVALPTSRRSGHALAADLTDSAYLFVSVDTGAFRFHKDTMTFEGTYDGSTEVNRATVKGLAHNQNGNFCLAIPNGGKGSAWETMGYGGWCTDTLIFCTYEAEGEMTSQAYKSAKRSAFYKVVAFCGTYL